MIVCPLFPQELLSTGSAVVLWDSSHGSSLSRHGLVTDEHRFYQGTFRVLPSISEDLVTIHSTGYALNIFCHPQRPCEERPKKESLDNQVFESVSM